MKTVSTALQTLLQQYVTGEMTKWYIADLYTFWLNWGATYTAGFFNSGKILTYTGHDVDLQVGGNTYYHWAMEHGEINEKRGCEVTDMDFTINYNPFDTIYGLGVTWIQALQSGMFDGCYLSVDRLYSPEPWEYFMPNISTDYVLKARFFGRCNIQDIKFTSASLSVKCPTELLNTGLPRNLITPSCINSFCDSMCGLTKSSYAYSVTALNGSSKSAISSSNRQSDGFFTQGTMLCTSGANMGVTRTIKLYQSNVAYLSEPFQFAVNTGDTFTFYRGCGKTISECTAYGNLANYRGFPFLPVVNTLL